MTREELEKYYIDLHNVITSPEARENYFSNLLYMNANSEMFRRPFDGKLNGLTVLKLSVNCGRKIWIERMKEKNLLDRSMLVKSCYGGNCWQEYTIAHTVDRKRGKISTIADLSPRIVKASTIGPKVAKMKRDHEVFSTFMFREGQSGDSSHTFIKQDCGYSCAVAWMKALKEKGITIKTVFITSTYAPVTIDEYKDLLPYRDHHVIHFSLSGWFTIEEIDLRLCSFVACRKSGLDPFVRLVTNKDNLSNVPMENEAYLMERLQALGITRDRILETPFHDDSIKKVGEKKRSDPSMEKGPTCCETGHCNTCNFACMTK